jgi:GNAT superfamily N-acetyltransferase
MPRAPVTIRVAIPDDGERLREIAAAAKGHWGYPPSRVLEWAAAYDFSAAALASREVLVAVSGGRPVAWAGLLPSVDDVALLDDLWVEPASMGGGIGRALFRKAVRRAGELGAVSMEWETEPNAVGFYERMGGRRVGERVSEWGRPLAVMSVPAAGPAMGARTAPRRLSRRPRAPRRP